MDRPTESAREEHAQPSPITDEVIRRFVEHWGMMARAWGINATMGELFALLYITSEAWTADDLRHWLRVSRGNVSMNLRELLSWGVVHKVRVQGERRELFRAETEVWTLFRRILTERKRRELAPTLQLLDETHALTETDPRLDELKRRIEPLKRFFTSINALSDHLLTLNSTEFDDLSQLLGFSDPLTDSA
jgi:DNA-binding transcriptional regulator GbsR (MarR family)